jgi:hypothetical protein
MAAPAGSSAVEAYKNTKSRGAKPGPASAFVPKTSPEVAAKAEALHGKAIKNVWEAASAQDPFRPTGEFTPAGELPRGTYGGKKSRRRKTRRRGGAMVKSMRELKADLEREPTEATLRNVLSDLKGADNGRLREYAEEMEERLEDAAPPYQNREDRVRMIVERVVGLLNMQGRGRRRKTTRRR